ncbi:ATP-binding protein [Beggiatoa leptomitoformis]|uniref:histidine kinase n=1 Tax=Beggiatoa leptomitoformis TaxID=288004 RepID=A0A2N9YDG2_9GAMM|nr:ATP-binding protein [Beggiatoa leptomitoformis]ALG69078.1 hypothetical protein AL038_17030 [Beggiatoa leptomitoformis]AUI68511.1 hypothetical protein BLE401_07205 [Beggiatoa leptomitoformis]
MEHYNSFIIPPKHEHRLLGLMLITLHIALWWDFSGIFSRLILLAHFGAFVIWQPFWGRGEPANVKSLLLLSIGALIFIIFSNTLLITIWQIMLLGLMGGRDLVKPHDRFVNMAAIIFLTLNLFIFNIPQLLLPDETMHVVDWVRVDSQSLLRYGLLCIPLSFLFISTDDSFEHRYHLDFFHGLTLSLLMIIIGLGSLVIMYHNHISYPVAVFQMSLAIAIFVLAVSWLWATIAGEEGAEQLWTRHLLNIGSSFEKWLDGLAQPGNYRNLNPQAFLYSGFEQLSTLPWVSGIVWHSLYGEGTIGKIDTKHFIEIEFQSIEVKVYAYYRISSSNYFHVKILIQLLEHFHQAKRREDAFAQQAHLQAIHETGAKLTHDIKNLLQSLHAISSAIETCQPAQFGDTQRLLQGQMPRLTQRLKRTLDKLQKPAEFASITVPVLYWWDNLQARYRKRNVIFHNAVDVENILIPEDAFDNVVENLLENALLKRTQEPDLNIDVTLTINREGVRLTVCDDGSEIPRDIAKTLLNQPVASSKQGFGIGLYHAAQQIAQTGYQLRIANNDIGEVCFELVTA